MGSKGLNDGIKNRTNHVTEMPSFVPSIPTSSTMISEANNVRPSRIPSFGVFDQSLTFHIDESIAPNRNSVFNQMKSGSQIAGDLEYSSLNKELLSNPVLVTGSHRDNWGDTSLADASPRTDTSTDDTDERNISYERGNLIDNSDRSKVRPEPKNMRRLVQNREAARKSRLKKKVYVQQLESSKLKLTQLEQELQRSRQQGLFTSNSVDQLYSMSGNGALAFDAEYARWMEDHNRHMNELRSAVNSHAGDTELRTVVESAIAQFNDIYRVKRTAAKADVFHILSGMWKTPAERCFMWIGGFKSSELLKILSNQLEPLTEQQLIGIYNLQQSSQEAEDALSQGMESLQQNLAETLANGGSSSPSGSGNGAYNGGQMAMALAVGKLETLEGFLRQADNLRQQTLEQLHRILTTRQSARAMLAITEYFSRLRALSSLWMARPRD